ncbi:MAG: DUF3788 domain-containing protein [Clostridiales bacterium]|nr:DUF3788 domain-containing protein [Clostridiales bacterium]
MEWHQLYPRATEPSMEEIAEYIGGAKDLWLSLTSYFESTYNAKPKITYSGCSGMPGWNVKYQKSGQAFGTLYPKEDFFDVMVILSYRLEPAMETILPSLSKETATLYRNAGDYMKIGRYMMLRIDSKETLEDYKKIVSVKLPPPVK